MLDITACRHQDQKRLVLQLKDDTARCEEEEAEKKVKLKAMREHHHKWEDTREGRVGTWRDFVKGKKTRVRLACCYATEKVMPFGNLEFPSAQRTKFCLNDRRLAACVCLTLSCFAVCTIG